MAELLTNEDIKTILKSSCGRGMDSKQVDYATGLIAEQEPRLRADKMTAEFMADLLTPFVDEKKAGLSVETIAVEIFQKLKRKLEGVVVESEQDDPAAEFALKVPISVLEILEGVPVDRENEDASEGATVLQGSRKKGGGLIDPFLGLDALSGNLNESLLGEEAILEHKAKARNREKQLKMMREWLKEKAPLPAPKKKHGDAQTAKLTDVLVSSFSVAVGGRELLKNSALKIVIGRRYGLIGRNGIGKTTFLNALVRGEIKGIEKDVTVGCVEQEFTCPEDWTGLEAVLSVDEERNSLMAEETSLTSLENPGLEAGKRLTEIYARLDEIQAHKMESQAASILSGLGFSDFTIRNTKIKELSGGWRMRIVLARVLFSDPDILCLDEPTNHLDLHAVAWLAAFLKSAGKTCIVVSHSRNFLNDICTDIIEFKDQLLKYYPGDYDDFEKQKAEQLRVLQRQTEAQQAKIEHTQKFIDRFRYNSKRSALVQSRIKALQKLPLLQQVTSDPTLVFHFLEPEDIPTPILTLQNVSFSFDTSVGPVQILNSVDLNIDLESRIAICGVNGSGKSTLLRILIGQYEVHQGSVARHNKLRIGYFAQHHVDTLDLTMNAVQQLQAKYPTANLSIEAARAYLGRFGISGTLSLEPLFILSGGQKSRVAIALMAFSCPHILILDEPTNHLDLEAVQALIAALNDFEGGVVLVSHDSHILDCVVDDVFHLDPKTHRLDKFKGSFSEYRRDLLKKK